MNWKNLAIASLFSALSFAAVAATAQDGVQSHNYRYGDHLDIVKVVSVDQVSPAGCGVVKTRMTYLDSAGMTQVTDYLTIAENCGQEN